MVQTTVQKTKSSQLNDKRSYFPDWVLSLPYGHKALDEKDEFKKQKGQKIEKYFWQTYFRINLAINKRDCFEEPEVILIMYRILIV